MSKRLVGCFVGMFIFLGILNVYASDWDKAGKVLTGIEGLRLITAGRMDLIGNLFGLNHTKVNSTTVCCYRPSYRRVWVPNYVWKKKYVPRHTEYDPRYGKIIVEGHYIRYKVERGGHWEWIGD